MNSRLDELEKALREYKAMLEDSVNMKKTAREEMIEELEKFFGLGGTSTSGQQGGTSQGTEGTGGTGDIKSNLGSLLGKKDDDDEDEEKEDKKKDKKMIAEALDRHNEKKHGEAKDEDSAKKDMEKAEAKSADKVKHLVNPESGAKKVGVERSKTGAGPVKTYKPGDKGFDDRAREASLSKQEHKAADRVKFKVNPEQGAKNAGVERTKTGAGPVKDVTDKVSAEEKSKYEQAINKSEAQELIKYNELGQWTLSKAEDSKKKLK